MHVGQTRGNDYNDQPLQALDMYNTTELAPTKELLSTLSPPQIASFFKKLNLFTTPNEKSSESDDENNEIQHGDVIEIDVPVIGSFSKLRKYHSDNNKIHTNEAAYKLKGYDESSFTTKQSFDISQTVDVMTFTPDFQKAPDDGMTLRNDIEITTQLIDAETSSGIQHLKIESDFEYTTEDIRSAQSKFMEQWKTADDMIDGSFESKIFTLQTQRRSKYPFNVKINVNNKDGKKSCRSKSSCSQVSRSRDNRDEPQFLNEYSDEDLFVKSEPDQYFKRPNGLRARSARRAADDMPITPAPRFPPIRGIKKPSFIENLENESSLERSERINKNLDAFVRFISVWAQVDKFISDRARGAVKKLSYLSGDDYTDDFSLGSKRRIDTKRTVDDPFT